MKVLKRHRIPFTDGNEELDVHVYNEMTVVDIFMYLKSNENAALVYNPDLDTLELVEK